jgi:putative spermidine/putrescine transport system permease protein
MAAPRYSTDWEALSLRLVFGALAAVAILFLVGPTLIMLLTSFTASQSLKFPPDGLSLRWYVALLDADQMQAAAWNSLVVAFWTTVVSVLLGTAAALGIARSRSARRVRVTCYSCRRCCCRRSPSASPP